MPQLETLHTRDGHEGPATSFRSQASPPSATRRDTWPHALRDVARSWEDVACDRNRDAQLAVYHEAPDKRFVHEFPRRRHERLFRQAPKKGGCMVPNAGRVCCCASTPYKDTTLFS